MITDKEAAPIQRQMLWVSRFLYNSNADIEITEYAAAQMTKAYLANIDPCEAAAAHAEGRPLPIEYQWDFPPVSDPTSTLEGKVRAMLAVTIGEREIALAEIGLTGQTAQRGVFQGRVGRAETRETTLREVLALIQEGGHGR